MATLRLEDSALSLEVVGLLTDLSGQRVGVLDGEVLGLPEDYPKWLRAELAKTLDNGWYTVPDAATVAARQGGATKGRKRKAADDRTTAIEAELIGPGNPWTRKHYNITRQVQIRRAAPALAERLQREAATAPGPSPSGDRRDFMAR
jgi:hypothetical protein